MSKIYLVRTANGTFEEYYTGISKAFFNKNDAEKYVEEYNKDTSIQKSLFEKCENCPIRSEDVNVAEKCKKYCSLADIEVYEDDYYKCKNEADYYTYEEHDAVVVEMEVE